MASLLREGMATTLLGDTSLSEWKTRLQSGVDRVGHLVNGHATEAARVVTDQMAGMLEEWEKTEKADLDDQCRALIVCFEMSSSSDVGTKSEALRAVWSRISQIDLVERAHIEPLKVEIAQHEEMLSQSRPLLIQQIVATLHELRDDPLAFSKVLAQPEYRLIISGGELVGQLLQEALDLQSVIGRTFEEWNVQLPSAIKALQSVDASLAQDASAIAKPILDEIGRSESAQVDVLASKYTGITSFLTPEDAIELAKPTKPGFVKIGFDKEGPWGQANFDFAKSTFPTVEFKEEATRFSFEKTSVKEDGQYSCTVSPLGQHLIAEDAKMTDGLNDLMVISNDLKKHREFDEVVGKPPSGVAKLSSSKYSQLLWVNASSLWYMT